MVAIRTDVQLTRTAWVVVVVVIVGFVVLMLYFDGKTHGKL